MSGISKTLLQEKFVDQLLNFVKELENLFPNDNKDFKLFSSAVKLVRRTASDKYVHNMFMNYVEVYRIKIETRDESFFLNNDYQEVKKDVQMDLNSVINKLKSMWSNLPVSEKNKIWDYFNLLLKLSDTINKL